MPLPFGLELDAGIAIEPGGTESPALPPNRRALDVHPPVTVAQDGRGRAGKGKRKGRFRVAFRRAGGPLPGRGFRRSVARPTQRR